MSYKQVITHHKSPQSVFQFLVSLAPDTLPLRLPSPVVPERTAVDCGTCLELSTHIVASWKAFINFTWLTTHPAHAARWYRSSSLRRFLPLFRISWHFVTAHVLETEQQGFSYSIGTPRNIERTISWRRTPSKNCMQLKQQRVRGMQLIFNLYISLRLPTGNPAP